MVRSWVLFSKPRRLQAGDFPGLVTGAAIHWRLTHGGKGVSRQPENPKAKAQQKTTQKQNRRRGLWISRSSESPGKARLRFAGRRQGRRLPHPGRGSGAEPRSEGAPRRGQPACVSRVPAGGRGGGALGSPARGEEPSSGTRRPRPGGSARPAPGSPCPAERPGPPGPPRRSCPLS